MNFLVSIIALVIAVVVLRNSLRYKEYICLRYTVFSLREQWATLYLGGKIPDEKIFLDLYDVMNMFARNIRELPSIMMLIGFYESKDRYLTEEVKLKEFFECADVEVQEWYKNVDKLNQRVMWAYSPFKYYIFEKQSTIFPMRVFFRILGVLTSIVWFVSAHIKFRNNKFLVDYIRKFKTHRKEYVEDGYELVAGLRDSGMQPV